MVSLWRVKRLGMCATPLLLVLLFLMTIGVMSQAVLAGEQVNRRTWTECRVRKAWYARAAVEFSRWLLVNNPEWITADRPVRSAQLTLDGQQVWIQAEIEPTAAQESGETAGKAVCENENRIPDWEEAVSDESLSQRKVLIRALVDGEQLMKGLLIQQGDRITLLNATLTD